MLRGTMVLVLLILPVAAFGQVIDCWDLSEFSTAALAYQGPGPVSLMVVPDGSGAAFDEARTVAGPVDATITLQLKDCWDVPIAGFPREDLWLESDDGGLVSCLGGTIADAPTDAAGRTSWRRPLRAGGASQAGCSIFINGLPLFPTPGLPLQFNGPDLDGNRQVNLTDLALFSGGYYGPYQGRFDFHFDGVVNLQDVVRMAAAFGHGCP